MSKEKVNQKTSPDEEHGEDKDEQNQSITELQRELSMYKEYEKQKAEQDMKDALEQVEKQKADLHNKVRASCVKNKIDKCS